ncbi:MAG: response regulator transcription factor [Scrofimicrobium sp.]
MIRVVVVDDHPIVRAGIVGLLETETEIDVVAEASSGEEAVSLAQAKMPDVVLMDLRMPGIGGVEATRRIVQQEVISPWIPRVLVFTTYEDDDEIFAAIEAGASGYLVKAAPAEEMVAGVKAVAQGQIVLAPGLAMQLARMAKRDPTPMLTPREREVLSLVAAGLSNFQIATRLQIGESTVKTHLLHVFEKLEVSDRTRAVTRAMELGLL